MPASSDRFRPGVLVGASVLFALIAVTLLALLAIGSFCRLEDPPQRVVDLLKYVLGALVIVMLGAAKAFPSRNSHGGGAQKATRPRRHKPK
jgi:hypothetical protein